MSGDLEDFLKRAAERRQAKAAQQQAPPKRVPPQYSDSRTERVPRPAPTNDVVEAQIVSASGAEDVVVAEAVPVSQNRSDKAKSALRKKTAKKAAASRQTLSGREQRRAETETMSTPYDQVQKSTGNRLSTGFSGESLVEMLKRPGGLQQAFLLREILDRPEHRW
jgi:hypothetical protein